MDELDREIAAYNLKRAYLESNHCDEWVVVHDGEIAGIYKEFEDAAEDAIKRFGCGPYLIRQVGEPPLFMPPYVPYKVFDANYQTSV